MSSDESRELILPRKFLRMCRRHMRQPKAADSTGAELTGAGLLTRTLIVRRLLSRKILGRDEKMVGVLLPPSVAGAVVNAALSIDCRVAVNLNYTVTSDVMNDCIEQCGIRHVLTSRRVMDRFKLNLNAKVVFLEDFLGMFTLGDKLAAAAAAWLAPISWLERRLGLDKVTDDDLLTVIFTSGSTGRPKGVMLTQRNVGSNVGAVDQLIRLDVDDVLVGILPLFHSFGYTTTLWTVLTLPPKGIYHFSPLESREVGKLCRKHGGTILVSTPTFLRSYLRRCEPEDFAKLDVVFTGAERLPLELSDAFEKRFGVRPSEGYGTSELSPVVSGNVPASRVNNASGNNAKDGSVGRPLPGIRAKIVDLDTGADLEPGREGMLLVAGPNVMKGYYKRPDLTAEVMRGEWYVTGDVATIDANGFITITGRLSRFSKLAGEMVPHIRIEETIVQILGLEDAEELKVAVTAVPDAKKGERLVVFHTEIAKTPEAICHALAAGGLPPLWIPSADSFYRVDAIPILGTGKLDIKGLKDLALSLVASGKP